VDDVLSVLSFQSVETFDHSRCLAAWTSVKFNSLHQIACAPVMEEEQALPNTPQRSCSELIGARATLRDAVRKTSTHVVDEEVGEQIHPFIGKRGTRACRGTAGDHLASGERWHMTVHTTYVCEDCASMHDGRRVGRRSGWGQHPHEVGKGLDVRDNGCVGRRRGGGREIECVFRGRVKDTAGSLVALLGKELVRNPHLDVICFSREHEKGLVLGLPAEAVIVPSFALRFTLPLRCALGRPEMPNPAFRDVLAFMFARIAESGIASMSPAPKTGVGIRKMMFGFPPCPVSASPAGKKSNWEMLQPAASLRPVITKIACTSPSLAPFGPA
jgi:hypothetical protein